MALEYKTIFVDNPREMEKLLNVFAADQWRLHSTSKGIIDAAGYQKDIGLTLFLERERGYVDEKEKEVGATVSIGGRKRK